MRKKWFVLAPAGIILFVAAGGAVVRLLWNWLLPPLFGLPPVTFWQALGLLVLSRILFGGFGGHRGRGMPVRERWRHMTPEQRARFRDGLRRHFDFEPPSEEDKDR
jgi:hypothetical protein